MSIDQREMTLERLAAKLAELEQANLCLATELATLRAERPPHHAPAVPPQAVAEANGQTSRRGMLRTVLGVAAATVGAGTLLEMSAGSASAANGGAVTLGATNLAESGTQVKWDGTSGFTGVILLGNDTGFSDIGAIFPAAAGGWAGGGAAGVPHGVYGFTQASPTVSLTPFAIVGLATQGTGVHGETQSSSIASIGVEGVSPHGIGVSGSSTNNVGVAGSGGLTGVSGTGTGGSSTGVVASGQTGVSATGTLFGVSASGPIGVTGSSSTSSGIGTQGLAFGSGGTGVAGNSSGSGGTGVLGLASNGDGVLGRNTNPNTPGNGVHAVTGGISPTAGPFGAVFAEAGPAGSLSGVYGSSTGNNGVEGHGKVGVYGNGGTGVKGISASGYGGDFQGGKAPIRLRPATAAGPPVSASHAQGELYVDVNGILFICTASGSPGTWVKVGAQ